MSYKTFFQQTLQIQESDKFCKELTVDLLETLNTSIKSEYTANDYVCAMIFQESLLNAVNLSVQQPQEPAFPHIEAPLPKAVKDAAYTNVVPLQTNPNLKTLKTSVVMQTINVPNIMGNIATRPNSKAQYKKQEIESEVKAQLKKFQRPPSAQEVRLLARDIGARQKQLKSTKLDVKVMNTIRKGEILDQLNALQKGNKKIQDFPENGQIVVDSNGKVVGVGGVKQLATQINQGECKIVKKETKKKDSTQDPQQQEKQEESPFVELSRKYEENLLKTQTVLKK
ncbi:hypothetical protein SS50377_21155 [Spironucleus salmonicida]|uniref:Uncharacterized protein n=1 Tax=Spironucleus salmonicida TaxID=348837 RepID=V6LJP2_9EUKA|nr:hypothetical protein SS50377_21155 [Spironucleus salmonicida]|eukprot:EST43936.1 hypothetical protein SS50377_fx091 [Spironucleus salmonicida]